MGNWFWQTRPNFTKSSKSEICPSIDKQWKRKNGDIRNRIQHELLYIYILLIFFKEGQGIPDILEMAEEKKNYRAIENIRDEFW